MEVTCPSCRTVYRIRPDKVPLAGARAKCPSCGGFIHVSSSSAAMPGAGPAGDGGDFGRTMAFDFASVDQAAGEATDILQAVSDAQPGFSPGFLYLLKESGGATHRLEKPDVLIGRSGGDINLTDPEVSRRHCRLRVFGQTAVVADQESTNGTRFGGRKVLTARLRPGEAFVIGNTTLEFLVEADD